MKLRSHFFFWSIAHLILTILFQKELGSWALAFFFVSFFMPSILLFSFLFNQVLVPRYLYTKKYGWFALYFFYTLVASLYIQSWVLMITFIVLNSYQIEGLLSLTYTVKLMALTMLVLVLAQSFILLIIENISSKRKIQDLKQAIDTQSALTLQVRSNRKYIDIVIAEILFVESLKDYIIIHLVDGTRIRVKEPISTFYKRLPDSFIRIHRSFIVNKQMVKEYSKGEVLIQDKVLPISRTYKRIVSQQLNMN